MLRESLEKIDLGEAVNEKFDKDFETGIIDTLYFGEGEGGERTTPTHSSNFG